MLVPAPFRGLSEKAAQRRFLSSDGRLHEAAIEPPFRLRFPAGRIALSLRQRHTLLTLVFAAAVLVAGLADLVAFEEEDLSTALARIDLRRQRRGVAEFERHVAFPFGLERGHVD